MKHKSITIWSLLLAMLMVGPVAAAYDFESDGFFYNINEDGTTVTLTTEDGSFGTYSVTGELILPTYVTNNGVTYTLTAIDRYAFHNCREMTAVTIPITVTIADMTVLIDNLLNNE